MGAGRPREHDRKKIAAELLEWSTNPTAFNLIQFSRPRMLCVTKLADWAEEDTEFREALKLAKQSIAMNRFEATLEGAMSQAEYSKSEGNYDPLYRKFSREERQFELEMKKQELKYASDLKKEENKDLANIDAERYSNAIKSKPLIKECG